MSVITPAIRQDIRGQAEKFLAEHGFAAPPLPPDEALLARKLEVTQLSLDDLLLKANLIPNECKRIQAMLNTKERAITFRDGLPIQQRNWGALHEIGHEYLPWHRELLYYCTLLWLPQKLQIQFETEADIFAAEAFFFGTRFNKYISQGEMSLTTAKQLAEEVYRTSLHATFIHYVEQNDKPCCLLVWKPMSNNEGFDTPQVKIQYYVKSATFKGHIAPGQIADPDDEIVKILNQPSGEVVTHKIGFTT